MKTCVRCNEEKLISVIGNSLFHFICDGCRTGVESWQLGSDITIKDMEYQMVEPENPSDKYLSRASRNKNVKQWQSSKPLEEIYDESHRDHLVLGHYCWNCRIRTSNQTQGWVRTSWSDGPKLKEKITDVVWADGGHDDSGECFMDLSHKCHMPVHPDHYKEIGTNGVIVEEN